jgi:hypothetical protein
MGNIYDLKRRVKLLSKAVIPSKQEIYILTELANGEIYADCRAPMIFKCADQFEKYLNTLETPPLIIIDNWVALSNEEIATAKKYK